MVKTYSDDNSVFVNITTTTGLVTVGSVYSRPRSNLTQDMKWLDFFQPVKNLLVGADLNAHLSLLGYDKEDERGHLLTYLILSHKLTLINDTEAPATFIGQPDNPCSTTPDVTLCSPDISDNVISWKVMEEIPTWSDHRYIRYSLDLIPHTLKLNRFKTKFTTFKKFNNLLKANLNNLQKALDEVDSPLQLDKWVENFNNIITDIGNKSLKIKNLKLFPTFNWWSDSLRTHRNKVSALYKRFRKSGDTKWKIALKKERAKYKIHIKSEKLKSWQNFCTTTTNKFGQAFKIATNKNLKNHHFIHTTLENNKPYETKSEVFEQLINYHFPIPAEQQGKLPDPGLGEEPQQNTPPPFTLKEIKTVLNEQHNLKAPGFDKQDAFILKNINKHFKHFIRDILNKCLTLNYFPTAWKIAQVVFFVKNNKDPTQPSSYRPICLLPMLGKVYERLLKHRIIYYLEKEKFLHKSQYGFREGRNTIQLLQKIKNKIKKYLQSHKYCSLISFDIMGAFDNINWKKLKIIIQDLPIPQYLKNIINSFITNRQIITDYLTNNNKRNTHQGCPQGSCLGPLLWLLVANKILTQFYQHFTNLYAFCDDFNLIIKANSRQNLECQANRRIALFLSICQSLDLQLSYSKTKFMLLGKHLERPPIFKLAQNNIEKVDNIKILGITFNDKLNWEHHILNIKEKITTITSSIKRVFSATWGVNREYLRSWYITVLEKIIDYGSEVWFDDLRIIDKRSLQSIQRLCLTSITKCYKNVSTHSLQVLLGIPPLLITLELKNLKSRIILQKDILLTEKPPPLTIKDFEAKILKYNINPELNIGNLIIADKIIQRQDMIHIYTDGSKVDNHTAFALIAFKGEEKIYDSTVRIQEENTVFQAELQAVVNAVHWAISSSYNKFQILTDSQATVLSLASLFPKTQTLYELKQLIFNSSNKLFYITWVRGHAGLKGNELADRLANDAAQYCDLPISREVKLPRSFLNKCIKQKILDRWQYNWDISGGGRFTYAMFPKVRAEIICKDNVSMYFLTGCGSFPSFLYAIEKKDDDLCQCGLRGDPYHYLFQNCKFMKYRFKRKHPKIMEDIMEIINNKTTLKQLYENYNILNSKYSFIRNKFLLN